MPRIRTSLTLLSAGRQMSIVKTARNERFDTILANAAAHILPLDFARHRRLVRGISRAGLGCTQRIQSAGFACVSFFAWLESCRIHDARSAQIPRLDIRVVS